MRSPRLLLFAALLTGCGLLPRRPAAPSPWLDEALKGAPAAMEARWEGRLERTKPRLESGNARTAEVLDHCATLVLRAALRCPFDDAAPCDLLAPVDVAPLETWLRGASMDLFRAVERGRAPAPAADRQGLAARDVGLCVAALRTWRSIVTPDDATHASDAARAQPALAALLDDAAPHAAALALAGRAVFVSRVSQEYGGRPHAAERDLQRARDLGAPLAAWLHALQGRFVCTARQDQRCFSVAAEEAEDAPASPAVRVAVEDLLGWVRAHHALLFLDAALPEIIEEAPPSEARDG